MRSAVTTVLVVLASVLAFLSLYAVWARRQALDGPTWADTSTKIVENPQVRSALAGYVADRLVESPDVRRELAGVLSPGQQSVGAIVLRPLVAQAADAALATSQAQSAWRAASLAAQQELIRVLDEKSGVVEASGGTIVLDLRELVRVLAERIKLDPALVDNIPRDDTQIVVARSNDITFARNSLRSIRGLSIVLPVLTLLLWAIALGVAKGRRRKTLAGIAIGLVLAAIAVLVTRSAAESAVLDRLVLHSADRPAAEQVWSIGTSLLRNSAFAAIAVAAVVLVAVGASFVVGRGGGTTVHDDLADLDRLRAAGRIGDAEYTARRRRLLSAE